MKRYYYNLWLTDGGVLFFYNTKKILQEEYENIIDDIMKKISEDNDKEEPYLCSNENFYKALYKNMELNGFVKITPRVVNYHMNNMTIW